MQRLPATGETLSSPCNGFRQPVKRSRHRATASGNRRNALVTVQRLPATGETLSSPCNDFRRPTKRSRHCATASGDRRNALVTVQRLSIVTVILEVNLPNIYQIQLFKIQWITLVLYHSFMLKFSYKVVNLQLNKKQHKQSKYDSLLRKPK